MRSPTPASSRRDLPFLLAPIVFASFTACAVSPSNASDSEDLLRSRRTYPAFKDEVARAMPQVISSGGKVLDHPRVVTVTFESDDPENVRALETFADHLGETEYWKVGTSEYGVAPIASDPSLHVRVPKDDLPRFTHGRTRDEHGEFHDQLAVLDTDVDAFAFEHATDPSSGWPAITEQTIYIVYVPASIRMVTRLSLEPGKLDRTSACESASGYHSWRTQPNGPSFIYAVVYEGCGDLSVTTGTASHELGETVTNPFPGDELTAFEGFDDDHVAWSIFNQWELETADACEFYADANIVVDERHRFAAQALWSNKAARAGRNPCVPANREPYYNVVPLDLEHVAAVVPPALTKSSKSLGYRIRSWQKKREFSLGFFSDADTEGEWTVSAVVGGTAGSIIGPPRGIRRPPTYRPNAPEERLAVTFDDGAAVGRGKNGDKIKVSIAADRDAPAQDGPSRNGIVVTFISEKPGAAKHYMPVLIALE